MRFRLFRSRAFWFGVPGLVFLIWGWTSSMHQHTSLFHREVGVCQLDTGQVHFNTIPEREKKWLPPYRVSRSEWHDSTGDSWFNNRGRMFMRKKDEIFIVIPFWKAVVGYLGFWIVIIGWRWWRRRRAIQATERNLRRGMQAG